MNIHLISAILKSVWAIDPEASLSYAPLLSNLIGTGLKLEVEFDGQEFKPFAWSTPEEDPIDLDTPESMENLPQGSIAIIPLKGPLMKNDQYCGPAGMATIGNYIKTADKSEKIDAIILHIDSPGGTVDGTSDLAEIVKNTSKPILAFADGMMGSAAMWIGSATKEIIAANNKTQAGSIGTMLSFVDLQPAFEALGVKFHSIVADQSSDKNKIWEELRAGKYENYKKEVLNPLAADFIAAIKQNRPKVKDDQLTGKVYFAENLVGTLVDSIGNFDYAVQRASALAAEYKKSLESQTKKPLSMKKQYKSVNALLAVEKLEAQEDGVFLNEDQVAAIDAALEKGGTDATSLEAANTAKTTAEADLATAQATIASKDAEIAQLKQTAGADPAKVIAAADPAKTSEKDSNVTDGKKDFMANLDAVGKEFLQ
jgi:protease-4